MTTLQFCNKDVVVDHWGNSKMDNGMRVGDKNYYNESGIKTQTVSIQEYQIISITED